MVLGKQHHIAIICSDWEQTREFYIEKLGFELIREAYRPQIGDYLRMIRQGDTTIEVFINKTITIIIQPIADFRFRHLRRTCTPSQIRTACLNPAACTKFIRDLTTANLTNAVLVTRTTTRLRHALTPHITSIIRHILANITIRTALIRTIHRTI